MIALPVNCPLSVPCNVDKLATDADTAKKEPVIRAVNEPDVSSKIVKFASISPAVSGEPLGILLNIAIFYISCIIRIVTQVNINKR